MTTDLCEYCHRPLSDSRRTGSEQTDAGIIRYHGECRDMIDAGRPAEEVMRQHDERRRDAVQDRG